ncbi:MAG: FtsX-like permease family protein [Bacteroidales bacterium]|nr:FtsX-like permease family protein [Bacteroidales bacterium]
MINIISAISAIGMAIGTAALIIIMSVYNGFDNLVKDSLGNVEPDIVISPSEGKVVSVEDSTLVAATDYLYNLPNVQTMSSVLQETVFIEYDGVQSVAVVKGVDSVYEEESPLSECIIEGEYMLHKGELPMALVGYSLAYKLNLSPRFVTKIKFYYPDRTRNISVSNPLASIESISVRPSATFTVNADVDEELIVLPIESVRELVGYEDEISAIEVRMAPGTKSKEIAKVIASLQDRLGDKFEVKDRFHQNESLYKMMKYEKASIFLILIFVIIIIAFNIFGSLSMLIIEKKGDIETFRSMGATDTLIRRVFVLEGWMISLLGLAAGLVIGVCFAILQQKTGMIKMPANFAVTAYPVIIKATDLILTTLGVAIIGYLIALAPSSQIRQSLPPQE